MFYNILNSSTAVRLTRGWSKRASFPLYYAKTEWETPAFVLSFDVDFRRDVEALPRVCRMLAQHKIPASFACVGTWVREYPKEHRQLLEEGHEMLNHSMNHPDNQELDSRRWNSLSLEEQRREIKDAYDVFVNVCGIAPRGFRMPHFGPQHRWHLYRMLEELGYAYSSSTTCGGDYTWCCPLEVKKCCVLELPTATVPRRGYASFDSFNYFNKKNPFAEQGQSMAEDFGALLKIVEQQNLLGTLYFDPWDFVARKEYVHILELLEEHREKIALRRYEDCVKMVCA